MVIEDGVDFKVAENALVATAVAVDKEEDAFLRGGTPERAEFENSIADEATEEDQLTEIDEDEWTETNNFGISNNSSSGGASSLDSRLSFIYQLNFIFRISFLIKFDELGLSQLHLFFFNSTKLRIWSINRISDEFLCLWWNNQHILIWLVHAGLDQLSFVSLCSSFAALFHIRWPL